MKLDPPVLRRYNLYELQELNFDGSELRMNRGTLGNVNEPGAPASVLGKGRFRVASEAPLRVASGNVTTVS